MKKYYSYKESGIEYIGNTPGHWTNYRIDWVTAIVRGNTGFKKMNYLIMANMSLYSMEKPTKSMRSIIHLIFLLIVSFIKKVKL